MIINNKKYAIGKQENVEDEISLFKEHIYNHRQVLNQEGVWLFLSTLGSWGVTQPIFNIFAFVITFYLFFVQIDQKMNEKKVFHKLKEVVEARIEELTAGSRYFCESLFWASQPKQAAKT
jgi:hypothetical protein